MHDSNGNLRTMVVIILNFLYLNSWFNGFRKNISCWQRWSDYLVILFVHSWPCFYFPPRIINNIPYYPPSTIILIEFGLAFLMLRCTVMGLKLEDEKKILPAAGFTMLAISIGVMMSSLFEVTQTSNEQSFEKLYYVTISSNFLYFPAMILIFFYDGFKKWIRILGLISCVPLLVSSVLFLVHYRNYSVLEGITGIGYILMGITQCLWAWSVYRNYKRKKKENLDA